MSRDGRILDDSASANSGERGELDHIGALMVSLGREEIKHYLRSVMDGHDAVADISERSSVHANGFSKLVLERRAGLAARLHIWRSTSGADDVQPENIHDHAWNFWSRVLVGTLEEQRFTATVTGRKMDHYHYFTSRNSSFPGILEFRGVTPLGESGEISHRAGSLYQLEDSTLHRAWAGGENGLSVTFVITGPRRKSHSSVFAPSGDAVREDPVERTLSGEEVRSLLSLVLDAI